MPKRLYFGVRADAEIVPKIYIGVGGTARNIVRGYIGVDGVAHEFYPYGPRYSYTISDTESAIRRLESSGANFTTGKINRYDSLLFDENTGEFRGQGAEIYTITAYGESDQGTFPSSFYSMYGYESCILTRWRSTRTPTSRPNIYYYTIFIYGYRYIVNQNW